jgi:hypothetical protein
MCACYFSQYLIYTTRLHRSLFSLKYGGSYLNKTVYLCWNISKASIAVNSVYNLLFRSE